MQNNRERTFAMLRKKVSLSESFQKLQNNMNGLLENSMSFARLASQAVGINDSTFDRMVADARTQSESRPELQKLRADLLALRASIELPENVAKHIEEQKMISFPHIIDFHILELLKARMENESVSAAEALFEKIQTEGTKVVWSDIKEQVRKDAKRICGNVFPDEEIAQGEHLALDMECLSRDFFIAKSLKSHGADFKRFLEQEHGVESTKAMLDVLPPDVKKYVDDSKHQDNQATPVAAAKPSRKQSESSMFSGLRAGFLVSAPAPRPNASDADTTSRKPK